MEKVLIRLEVPAAGQTFDVYVPPFLEIKDVSVMLAKAAEELTGGLFANSERPLLCTKTPEQLLNQNLTFEDYDIRNGDSLVLI